MGKFTSILVLAGELVRANAEVSIIDTDPTQPLSAWEELPSRPPGVTVPGGVDETTIVDVIDAEAELVPFVLVNLEGTAFIAVAYAVSRSDLVSIPRQGSHLDAQQAAQAVRLILVYPTWQDSGGGCLKSAPGDSSSATGVPAAMSSGSFPRLFPEMHTR